MSAIMGRYVKDGDMPSGAELCLECADYFDFHSSSAARREVTEMWIYDTPTCTMQGAAECSTPEEIRWGERPPQKGDDEGG